MSVALSLLHSLGLLIGWLALLPASLTAVGLAVLGLARSVGLPCSVGRSGFGWLAVCWSSLRLAFVLLDWPCFYLGYLCLLYLRPTVPGLPGLPGLPRLLGLPLYLLPVVI